MKFILGTVSLILRSHLVVSLAATLLAYQTLLLTCDTNFNNPILLLLFLGTLFVYNLAHLIIYVPSKFNITTKNILKTPDSIGFHVFLCLFSLLAFLIEIKNASWQEFTVISLSGICALAYEMPFSKNNQRIKGFRNVPFVKNIILALVWAAATAWLPLLSKMNQINESDFIFICLKRFFFVLSLSLVFDIRDSFIDLKNQMKTIPNQYGIQVTKIFALISMLFFVIVVYLHEKTITNHSSHLMNFSLPLYISALLTSIFILMLNSNRKHVFYTLIIDGSMIFQCMLVYIFVFVKF